MKRGFTFLSTVALLLAVTGIAVAAQPQLGPFVTSGYTTVGELALLPGGWLRFHVVAQGGGETDGDNAVCEAWYGDPCQTVCQTYLGQACGVTGFFEGAFRFNEWGVAQVVGFDPTTGYPITEYGANYGLMPITTGDGVASFRFDGQTDSVTVGGTFQLLDGSGAYKTLKGGGTYTGNGGYIFSVAYQPCGRPKGEPCPTSPCAVSGGALKVEKGKVKWEFSNNSQGKITLNSLRLWWPAANGAIDKIKLGTLTIADPACTLDSASGLYWTEISRSNSVAKGKTKLELTFENAPRAEPSDYVFLAQFAEGCAATYVGWPPPAE